MTPRTMALAYRIWCYAEPLGWDCSVKDIAEALDEAPGAVRRTCQARGWSARVRKESELFLGCAIGVPHRTTCSDLSDIIPEWGA